jgi:hypothetical protein
VAENCGGSMRGIMRAKIRTAQAKDKKKSLSVIGSYPFKWDKKIAFKYYEDYFSDKLSFKGDPILGERKI